MKTMKFTPPPSFFQPDFLELFKTFKTDHRHSSIYVVNVGTQGKKQGSNNRVNQGDLVVLKGRKIKIYGISLNKVRGH